MNFLAHQYLSGPDEQIRIGNFIADSVRRVHLSRFSKGIQDGIELHHAIDEFTDFHPVVKQSKERLYPDFGKYAAVIIDIFYDHFLAKNWKQYSGTDLEDFAGETYSIMYDNHSLLPERVQYMLPFMVKHNWLVSYRKMEGIERSLRGMARRARFDSGMENSILQLERNYSDFQEEFELFFPELEDMCREQLRKRNYPAR